MKLELISDREQVQIGTNKGTSYYGWGDVEIKSLKQAQAKLTAKQIYDWLFQECNSHPHFVGNQRVHSPERRNCGKCLEELKKAGE